MKVKRLVSLLIALTVFASTAMFTAASAEGEVTIRLVHYMGEQAKRDALDRLLERFYAEHPNVHVDIETVNSSSYIASYKNYIAAGEAPDLFFGKPQNMTEFIEGGYFQDLTGMPYLENVNPLLIKECTVNGGVYGFPIDTQVKAVFYNKKMFEENGLKVPTTKDEFIAVCDTFMAKGIYPMVLPYNFIHGVFHQLDAYFTAMAVATGNENVWMDSQHGVADLSGNPVIKEAFDYFSQLASYKEPGDNAVDQTQGIQNFAAGLRPMYINGGWLMGDVIAASPDGEFGMFPMPWSNKPEENKIWVGIDDCFIVSSSTQHPEEVKALLTSFASNESSEIWLNTANLMSSNVNVPVDNANSMIKEFKAYIDAGETAAKADVPDYTSEFSTAFRTKLQYFVTLSNEERNVDQLIQDIDAEIRSIR